MAFFGVTVETIGQIKPIKGADRIELASLKGVDFSFVVKKGQFNVGDSCVYFPLDSLIPDNIIKKVGLWDEVNQKGKLSGKTGNRVKTIKLRNCQSQGLVAGLDILPNPLERDSQVLTLSLGVTKFQPQAIISKNANLLPLPLGLGAYDIEGCERFGDIVELLMDTEVIVHQKLQGMNGSISWDNNNKKIFVNQRNFTIEQKEGERHSFWVIVQELDLVRKMEQAGKMFNKSFTLYFEVIGPGIMNNIYNLPKHDVRFFDLMMNGEFMPYDGFTGFLKHGVGQTDREAPLLFRGRLRDFIGDSNMKEKSHGKSVLFEGTLRQGIVIKPTKQMNVHGFGRVIVKQRDPIYLGQQK